MQVKGIRSKVGPTARKRRRQTGEEGRDRRRGRRKGEERGEEGKRGERERQTEKEDREPGATKTGQEQGGGGEKEKELVTVSLIRAAHKIGFPYKLACS